MKKLIAVLLVVVALFVGACQLVDPNPFVGTWEANVFGIVATHTYNADMSIDIKSVTLSDGTTVINTGTYSYTDTEVTYLMEGSTGPSVAAYTISDTTLVITPDTGGLTFPITFNKM